MALDAIVTGRNTLTEREGEYRHVVSENHNVLARYLAILAFRDGSSGDKARVKTLQARVNPDLVSRYPEGKPRRKASQALSRVWRVVMASHAEIAVYREAWVSGRYDDKLSVDNALKTIRTLEQKSATAKFEAFLARTVGEVDDAAAFLEACEVVLHALANDARAKQTAAKLAASQAA
jgi:hypothetical protein